MFVSTPACGKCSASPSLLIKGLTGRSCPVITDTFTLATKSFRPSLATNQSILTSGSINLEQPAPNHSPRSRNLLVAIVVFTAVYFVAGKLSLKLAFLNASASPVWPPAGMAVAALLLFGYRLWPGLFVGAFLVNVLTAGNILTSIGIALGNPLEGLTAVWLIRQIAGGLRAFDRAHDVFRFTLAIAISTVISATIGVTTLALAGFADWKNYGAIWVTWWLGDFSGAIIFAPVLILWLGYPWRRLNLTRDAEVAVLFVLLAVLSEIVFGGWFTISTLNYPIAFILGPIIAWTAFRLTPRETATSLFALSALSVWGTLTRFGPFVRSDENQSLLILQSFNVLTTITAVALAAGMSERRRAEAALEQQRADVEAANRTKDNFLAMLSHELRTPLTPVLAALDALKAEPYPAAEVVDGTLSMMRRNIELESQLIDDLLDLTRITKERMQLDFEPVDAHQAIREVVDMCASEANGKNLQVHLDLRANDFRVMADPAKFQQIIWNL